MRPGEVVRVAAITVIAVGAGAELVYFALTQQYGAMLWAALFLCFGFLSSWLTWPEL